MSPEGATHTDPNPREHRGANNPPTEFELLAERNKDVIDRQAELLAAFARVPEIIDNDDLAGKAGDMVGMIRACVGVAETRHKSEKAPFLDSCKMVDGWLNGLVDPLKRARTAIDARVTAYLEAKDRRKRQEAEAEAQRLRDEAAKKVETVVKQEAAGAIEMVPVQSSNITHIGYSAEELHVQFKSGRFAYSPVPANVHAALMASVSKGQFYIANVKGNAAYTSRKIDALATLVDTETTLQTAAALETRAAQVETTANARPAELTRTRGDMGSVASLKRTPDYRVVDLSKVPTHLLMINDAAVKAHIKTRAKDHLPPEVAGLEFTWKTSTNFR